MKEVDHSSFAWKKTRNTMILREPGSPYQKSKDKDGLDKSQRKRIEDIKNEKLYGEELPDM